MKDEDSQYCYKYEYVEISAAWLNTEDPSPNAEGEIMLIDHYSVFFNIAITSENWRHHRNCLLPEQESCLKDLLPEERSTQNRQCNFGRGYR